MVNFHYSVFLLQADIPVKIEITNAPYLCKFYVDVYGEWPCAWKAEVRRMYNAECNVIPKDELQLKQKCSLMDMNEVSLQYCNIHDAIHFSSLHRMGSLNESNIVAYSCFVTGNKV